MAIPIRIHPFFWLLAGFIGWMSSGSVIGTIIWMVVILVSVLVHEFGHALTAIFFGQRAAISLVAFGGLTERSGPQINLWKEFIIVINGPLAGLMLAGVAYVAFLTVGPHVGELGRYALQTTYWVNLFWTVLNLLPVNPLDGGKLFRIVLEGIFGFSGVKFSTLFSTVFCAFFGLAFFAYSIVLPGAIFFILAFENFIAWRSMRTMTEVDQDTNLWQVFTDAERASKMHDFDKAWSLLEELNNKVDKGTLHVAILQLKAEILLKKHRYTDAYDLIKPIINDITPDYRRTAQVLAFYGGNSAKAIELGNQAYQDTPHYEIAVINAMCHAIKGEATAAVGWLKRAYDDGVPNFRDVLKKQEFDSIRRDPQFDHLAHL